MLKTRAVSRATPIVSFRGTPSQRELSSHNAHRHGTLRSWRVPHTFDTGEFKTVKIILPQLNIFTINLQT